MPRVKLCWCGRPQPCDLHKRRRHRTSDYDRALHSSRWVTLRKTIRARDGNRCQLAGDGECWGRLEVHHRVPVRDGGEMFDPDNLVVVCRGHHEQIEKQSRDQARQAIIERNRLLAAKRLP